MKFGGGRARISQFLAAQAYPPMCRDHAGHGIRLRGFELVVLLDAQRQSRNGQREVELHFCGFHFFDEQIGGIEQIDGIAILHGVSPKK